MYEEDNVRHQRNRGLEALKKAKTVNADKIVRIQVNPYTEIYISEKQRQDKEFMRRLHRRWGIEEVE